MVTTEPSRSLRAATVSQYRLAIDHWIVPHIGAIRIAALPGLATVASQLAAPAMVASRLVGVLAVESEQLGAFADVDESLLAVVAHVIASAIELRSRRRPNSSHPTRYPTGSRSKERRTYGERFGCDHPVLPGRWQHLCRRRVPDQGGGGTDPVATAKRPPGGARTEFTNREVRLDRSLEMPAYRDNLESRLVLLQRRLDERQAPVRIRKTGRGKFRLELEGAVTLELIEQYG